MNLRVRMALWVAAAFGVLVAIVAAVLVLAVAGIEGPARDAVAGALDERTPLLAFLALLALFGCAIVVKGLFARFVTPLRAIAEQALKRGTGARGLRAVIEESMLDVMYDIPSRADVIGCTISRECILGGAPPLLTYRGEREKRRKEA